MSKKKNYSLLLKVKEDNHKPRQSNAAVVSAVGNGGVKLRQM